MNISIVCAWALSPRTIREAEAAAFIVLMLFLLLALMSMFNEEPDERR